MTEVSLMCIVYTKYFHELKPSFVQDLAKELCRLVSNKKPMQAIHFILTRWIRKLICMVFSFITMNSLIVNVIETSFSNLFKHVIQIWSTWTIFQN